MNKKSLFPVVKLRSPITYPDKSQTNSAIVIKMQDFLRKNGKPNIYEMRKVDHAGSLHEYFGTSSRVILSPIMPDSLLQNIDYNTYAYIIETLRPDQYITPDGITYTGFTRYSRNQINHILAMTEKLLNRFPELTPIGLVKGSDLSQMDYHLDNLHDLGITQICLHVGDFLYKESIYSRDQVCYLARHIREKVPYLIIYGVGSKHYFRKFHFADAFVTNSHFIQAFNHKTICGVKWVNFKGKVSREIIMRNFEYLRKLAEGRNDGCTIFDWVPCATAVKTNEQIPDNFAQESKKLIIMVG